MGGFWDVVLAGSHGQFVLRQRSDTVLGGFMGLGKKLKKAVKSVSSGGLSNILGYGGSAGPDNPYSTPDLSFLRDTSKLDFLKDPRSNPYVANLPSSMRTFAGSYRPPEDTSDTLFNDLLGAVPEGPTSSDAIYKEMDSERLAQMLEGIDIDTKGTVGSLKSDFADRGLSGPGMLSDIESVGLAQAYGDAGRTKAGARSEFATKELDRIRAREEADRDAKRRAYEARYGAGIARGTQERDIASRGALSDAASFNELLGEQASLSSGQQNLFAQLLNARDLGYAGQTTGAYGDAEERRNKYAQPGYLDSILRNIRIGVGA